MKAINHLAALHVPIDGAVKTPHPSARIFEQCEARQLSQAGSMLVIEGESPMVPQSNKRSHTHSDDEIINPTPYKCVKPTVTPSLALNSNASPKLQPPTEEISDINVDNDDDLILHDNEMLTKEEKLEVMAIVNKKLKEIEATRRANIANEKKD